MYAALLSPKIEPIDYLLQLGADVKLKDTTGHNTLYYLNRNEKLSVNDKKNLTDKIYTLMQQ